MEANYMASSSAQRIQSQEADSLLVYEIDIVHGVCQHTVYWARKRSY